MQQHLQSPPWRMQNVPHQHNNNCRSTMNQSRRRISANPARSIFLASFVSDLARPDPSRFYEPDYKSTLARMIEHVIKIEAPIYEDLLIERIARPHGFQPPRNKI